MTPTEIREAVFIISLMREGHKPRPERIDGEAKKRIDDSTMHIASQAHSAINTWF